MLIGFAGDVHGLVYHAIALVTTWQRKTGKKLDLVVQVGDMGAYHALDRVDEAGRRHIALDPAQGDFSRLLQADGLRAERLRAVRGEMASSIHFLRGNHEDFEYLGGLARDEPDGTVTVDQFDLFRYDKTIWTSDYLDIMHGMNSASVTYPPPNSTPTAAMPPLKHRAVASAAIEVR